LFLLHIIIYMLKRWYSWTWHSVGSHFSQVYLYHTAWHHISGNRDKCIYIYIYVYIIIATRTSNYTYYGALCKKRTCNEEVTVLCVYPHSHISYLQLFISFWPCFAPTLKVVGQIIFGLLSSILYMKNLNSKFYYFCKKLLSIQIILNYLYVAH
jgi:hypothetical protein